MRCLVAMVRLPGRKMSSVGIVLGLVFFFPFFFKLANKSRGILILQKVMQGVTRISF